jgi:hypothetical protein
MKGGCPPAKSRDDASGDIDAPRPAMNRPMAFSQSRDELKGSEQKRNRRNQRVAECPDRIRHNYIAHSGVYTDPNAIEHTEEAK